jgi:Flp pilus assembly protein TadD
MMVAYLIATRPTSGAEEITEALQMARLACGLTENRSARAVDTLAAAQARAGDFASAINSAEKAVELARVGGDTRLIEEVLEHLHGFQQSRPVTIDRNQAR